MEKTSDIRFCCFYNISDTIQHYPHRPSKAYFCFCFFFIFSAASNEKNKKPQSRAPLGYKLVWAAIEAMVTFMVQFFSRKRDSILIILLQPHVRIFKTAHKSQPSNSLCTAAPLPQIKIGKGAPYFSDFFLRGRGRLHTGQTSNTTVLFIPSSLEKRRTISAQSPGFLHSVKNGPYVTSLKETSTDPFPDFVQTTRQDRETRSLGPDQAVAE